VRLLCLFAANFLVSTKRRIDLFRPGIDPAAHALRIYKSVPAKVGSGIEAADAVMAHHNDRSVLGPALHDLLRQRLIDQDAAGDTRDLIFLGTTHIEQFDSAQLQQFGRCLRRDLDIFFHVLTLLDVTDDLVHVQAVVERDGSKRVGRLESATAASSHVISLEKRTLRRRKNRGHLFHRPGARQIFRIGAHRRLLFHQRFQRADVQVIVLDLDRCGLDGFLPENSRK